MDIYKKTVCRSLICLLLCLSAINSFAYDVINAEKNAYRHNNKGLIYLNEKYYFGAIKEFQIAIDILPEAQASAVFYSNLAEVYEKTGDFNKAEALREKALSLDGLYFQNYLNLAHTYKMNGKATEKINYYSSKKDSVFNEVLTGVLYMENGNTSTGITMLDNFCEKEPELILSKGIRNYLNNINTNTNGNKGNQK